MQHKIEKIQREVTTVIEENHLVLTLNEQEALILKLTLGSLSAQQVQDAVYKFANTPKERKLRNLNDAAFGDLLMCLYKACRVEEEN